MFKALGKITKKLFGDKYDKDVKSIMPYVTKANEIYEELKHIDIDQLRGKTDEFRATVAEALSEIDLSISELQESISSNPDMDPQEKESIYAEVDKLKKRRDEELEVVLMEILPEAFAVVKETARRFKDNDSIRSKATQLDRDLSVDRPHITIEGDSAIYSTTWEAAGNDISWDMLHYDVQLIGGIVLHQGKIAEMATGEGKTLVATLPAYLNGLTGLGVHIVTVNNYLARRDAEWMGTIYNFLGLTWDVIDKYQPHSAERKAAYDADITYGTNNEFGFDYLRENMARSPEDLTMRKLHFAMIDEVDSVLVDDARTPLIISGQVESNDEEQFYAFKPRIQKLFDEQKKLVNAILVDAKNKIKSGDTGIEEGQGAQLLLRSHRGLPKNSALIKFLSETGNKQLLQKAENFYLQDNSKNMPLVDEVLFFTIEEKTNSVQLTEKGINLITAEGEDSTFFIMPDVGGEIAELEQNTELEEKERLKRKDALIQDFAIKSERIHTVNQLLKAYTMFEKEVEYVVMDGKVKIVDEQTGRIMDGRRYSDGLHQAIEAKESVKVEKASQTMATVTLQNFFRMYHKLAGMTGTAETESGEFWEIYKLDVVVIPTNRPIVRDDQNDLIYRTKREKYNAAIEQIVQLSDAGRPVLVGTTTVEVSELLSRMLKMRKIPHNVLNAKQHAREANVVAEAGIPGNITIATNMAGRGTDIKISDQVKADGGLAIIGTERHDSRRVDRQLRGRAGRQGDPGSSVFYVSMEDDLMRLFGSDRMAKVMDRMGYDEGEVLTHSMLTSSIERAQTKVEENNFGVRKRLLEYDDVMNSQRTVIYSRRKNALLGERLSVDINNMFYDLCEEIVEEHKETNTYDALKLDVIRYFSVDSLITEEEFESQSNENLTNRLFEQVWTFYERKGQTIREAVMPIMTNIHKDRGETVKNVAIPFTDGQRSISISSQLQKVMDSDGRELVKDFEKSTVLAFIDNAWKGHLRALDDLKQSVQMASYEQKDPLVIYKLESFNLFKEMLSDVNKQVASFLCKGNIPVQKADDVKEAQAKKRSSSSRYQTSRKSDVPGSRQNGGQAEAPKKVQPVRVGKKVGRNEPCPCGSGKKYKHCHAKAESNA